ncbi:MAG: outer membrane beta-barrel protein, partial [bacterium]|nr:outer membrane beta-barrel protein [bacterium]
GGDTDFLEDLVEAATGSEDSDVFGQAANLVGYESEIETYNISAGFSLRPSDSITADFDVGWRYTESDQKNETLDPETGALLIESTSDSGDGLTSSLKLSKEFADTKITVDANQNVGTNPNSGATFENRRISLRTTHAFTPKLSTNLSLRYRLNDTDPEDEFGGEVDRDIFNLTASLSYRLNKRLSISATYLFSRNENKIRGTQTERNTFYIALKFAPQKPFIF